MINFENDLLKEGIELTKEQLNNFDEYYSLLVEENKITNLTRIVEKEEVFYFHFYDSLMVSKALDLSKEIKLLDVGSGPGFPGVPLKLAFDNIDETIVEATNKKIEFIKKTIDKFNIKNINPIHSRAEDFKELNTYDYVTTRAVSTINEQLPYTIPFLKIGGKLVAMKGELKAQEEINEAKQLLNKIGAEVKDIIKYRVLDRNYCLVVIEKIKPTPKCYPSPLHKEKK